MKISRPDEEKDSDDDKKAGAGEGDDSSDCDTEDEKSAFLTMAGVNPFMQKYLTSSFTSLVCKRDGSGPICTRTKFVPLL